MRLTTEACSPVLTYTSVCTPMPQKMCVPQHTAQTLPVPDVRKTSQRACEVVAPFTTGSHSFSAFAFVCLSRVSSSRRESAFIADQSEPNGQRKGGAWHHGSPHGRDWTRSSARLACNGLAGGNVVAEAPQPCTLSQSSFDACAVSSSGQHASLGVTFLDRCACGPRSTAASTVSGHAVLFEIYV